MAARKSSSATSRLSSRGDLLLKTEELPWGARLLAPNVVVPNLFDRPVLTITAALAKLAIIITFP
jgi:hypothetical protein